MQKQVTSPLPNAVTRTVICVDRRIHSDFCGTLYNPYMPGPVSFMHITDIIGTMERFFNQIAYPQPTFEDRSFLPAPAPAHYPAPARPLRRYMEAPDLEQQRGRLATFVLQVRFRQNASWQGELIWKEGRAVWLFHSTLEMIRLMDQSAIASSP